MGKDLGSPELSKKEGRKEVGEEGKKEEEEKSSN
jgi:hypothetical protein